MIEHLTFNRYKPNNDVETSSMSFSYLEMPSSLILNYESILDSVICHDLLYTCLYYGEKRIERKGIRVSEI